MGSREHPLFVEDRNYSDTCFHISLQTQQKSPITPETVATFVSRKDEDLESRPGVCVSPSLLLRCWCISVAVTAPHTGLACVLRRFSRFHCFRVDKPLRDKLFSGKHVLNRMEQRARPTLLDFQGVSMIKYFSDNWDKIQNFKARPDDIVIASYPKSGTTWVCYILDLLYFGQTCPEHRASIPLYDRVPFLESSKPSVPTGQDLAEQLPTTPRLIKTHLPVQFVPKSFWEQNSKIVYVARNPKDDAVSYYHFARMNTDMPEPGDWSTFLKSFMEGKVSYGSWNDHVSGWWEKKQTYSNLHYMFYEDLIEDIGREIERLCSFLGLSPSAEEMERVTAAVMFDNMKQDKMANFSTIQYMNQMVSPFMRKGKVGDWKNHFTVAQHEKFEQDYKKKMKNRTLQFRTEV